MLQQLNSGDPVAEEHQVIDLVLFFLLIYR